MPAPTSTSSSAAAAMPSRANPTERDGRLHAKVNGGGADWRNERRRMRRIRVIAGAAVLVAASMVVHAGQPPVNAGQLPTGGQQPPGAPGQPPGRGGGRGNPIAAKFTQVCAACHGASTAKGPVGPSLFD